MEIFPNNPFETVKARILGGEERQVMGVLGVTRGVALVETTGYLFLDERDWVAPGVDGSSKVGVVSAEVCTCNTLKWQESKGWSI